MDPLQKSHLDEIDVFKHFEVKPDCSVVHTLDFPYRCEYVRASKECKSIQFYFNYIELIYCILEPDTAVMEGLSIVVLLGICFVMFLILGITANTFFCPALTVLAKNLGLSEHLAGVTILAFGNGAPEFFVSIASYNDSSRTLINDVYATSIYIIAFVGGIICVLSPFKLSAHSTLRDVCFFLFSIIYVDYVIVSDDHVTVLESVGIISIYVAYLTIVLVDMFLLKRVLKEVERKVYIDERLYGASVHALELAMLHKEVGIEIIAKDGSSLDIDLRRVGSYNALAQRNFNLFHQLLQSVKPLDLDKFKSSGCVTKAFLIFRIPFIFTLKWLLPVVDFELERHGWSKLLNLLQITILPLVIFHSSYGLKYAYGIPSYAYILVFTVPLSCLLYFITRTDISPDYHCFFAAFTALGCMCIIYACACESVEILAALGIASNSSQAFLGCTVLAWGNGLGDLVTNVSMAKIGYQRMSYAACYGGPIFNSVLILGFANLFRALDTEEWHVEVVQGLMGENSIIFLVILCFSTLVWSTATDFNARRSIGIFSILVYIIYVLYILLGELEVIQTFAADA